VILGSFSRGGDVITVEGDPNSLLIVLVTWSLSVPASVRITNGHTLSSWARTYPPGSGSEIPPADYPIVYDADDNVYMLADGISISFDPGAAP